MRPERWQQVRHVLDAALLLESPQRALYLEEICAKDPALRCEVESLLISHEQAGSRFLKVPAVDFLNQAPESDCAPDRVGRRIGAYQMVEELGRGGMGEVYRAVRADGQYQKQVAVKLVRGGFDTKSILEGFRKERQILATLDHPNIARLLDGGTTEEGSPYLVMELIEGTPIDQYCDAHALIVTQRLQLFREICGAVQYAHQRLVIHRDIKPGNILVTNEGIPKLLDFGIAKILDPSTAGEITLAPAMTPEYASPEQVRGEPITTATDLYSLGVVVYQILTGHSPYFGEMNTPHELRRAICEIEPLPPSKVILRLDESHRDRRTTPLTPELVSSTRGGSVAKLCRQLAGDLDNIVLKAMQKEPHRRYASVEQFAEDVGRHLDRLPVRARKDSWDYRTGKFIRRHRAGVASAAVLTLSLLVGIAATIREARIANIQRQRSEQRFNDVRRLANSLMFEVHDSIENLPGSTPARKLIVQKSLEYLDGLSRESGRDVSLQRELATAYEKVGQVQGDISGPNLGEPTEALESFRKALAIRQAVVNPQPGHGEDQIALAGAYRRIGQLQWFSLADTGQGLENLREAVRIAETATSKKGGNLKALEELATDYEHLGDIQEGNGVRGSASDLRGALENHRKALALFKRMAEATPSDLTNKRTLAVADLGVGDDLVKASDREQALNHFRRAREILEPLLESTDDTLLRRSLAVCYTRTGDALLMNGRARDALRYYREESRLLKPMAAADPKDVFARSYLITSEGDIGHALVEAGRIKEGLGLLRSALADQAALANSDNDSHSRSLLASTHILTGEAFERTGNMIRAQQNYSQALDIYSTISSADPKDIEDLINAAATRNHLGRAYLKAGNVIRAAEEYRKALTVSDALVSSDPENMEALYALADTCAGLGDVSAVLAGKTKKAREQTKRWGKARDWYLKSVSTWHKIPNPAHISPNFFNVSDPHEIAHRAQLAARKARP